MGTEIIEKEASVEVSRVMELANKLTDEYVEEYEKTLGWKSPLSSTQEALVGCGRHAFHAGALKMAVEILGGEEPDEDPDN